jgi:CheY-like chemotaxis protein
MNLIGNAIKFTDEGAVRVRLGLSATRDAALIEVVDTGIGIAENRQEELFREFVQGDATERRRYGGSGLGLAISRRLARLLRGDIELSSALGEGSCFTLRLPLPAPVPDRASVRAAAAEPLRAWRLRLWHENGLVASELAEQLAAFGLAVEVQAALTSGAGIAGEIGLVPEVDGDVRGARRPRRVVLYPVGSPCPSELGRPGRAIAALRLPVVASDLIRRLVDAASATAPIKEIDAGDELLERVTRCAATAPPILLAEDSRPNQLVVTTILQRAGFRVDLAENGLQAVAAVNRSHYGVVLMDVAMPDMDGIEATGCIRALPGKRGRVPIVAMTANAFDEDRRRCLDAGMDDYLSKPVERQALYEALLRSLDGAIPAEQRSTGPSAMVKGDEVPVVDRRTSPVEQVLDEAVIEALRAELSDELLPEVVGAFVDEAGRRIRNIARAAAEGNAALAGREGHALKGSASQFGATALRQTASAIEEAGSSGSVEAVREQVDNLQARGAAAVAALREQFRIDVGAAKRACTPR